MRNSDPRSLAHRRFVQMDRVMVGQHLKVAVGDFLRRCSTMPISRSSMQMCRGLVVERIHRSQPEVHVALRLGTIRQSAGKVPLRNFFILPREKSQRSFVGNLILRSGHGANTVEWCALTAPPARCAVARIGVLADPGAELVVRQTAGDKRASTPPPRRRPRRSECVADGEDARSSTPRRPDAQLRATQDRSSAE